MLTVIYLRKSRADEDAETVEDTLRRHKETLLEFAARHGELTISRIYEDVVSGDSLYARPAMLELLQAAEKDEFEAVLCMDIDRLGRGATSEQGIILETFKGHGIRIITPRKVYDLNNELDEEYAEFESFMARRELKTIKRRLHNGTMKSLEEGCWLTVAPYGYKQARVNKKCTLEIYEPEAKFVRMAFELYCSGIGTQAIAHQLNALGAHPHRSDHFNRTSIAAMLRNKVYIGKVVWNKKHTLNRGAIDKKMKVIYHSPDEWKIYDGLHPAIIDEQTFDRANKLLASRYHKPYNDGSIINPLGGILKCSVCGYGMQRRPYAKTRKYQTDHILCGTKGCCTSSRLDYVEKGVLDNVQQKLDELIANRSKMANGVDFTPAIEGLKKDIATAEAQKSRLHDFLEQGVYDIDTYLERSNLLTERVKELQAQLEKLETKQTAASIKNYDAVIKRIENVLATYWKSSPPEKNALLKTILTGGTYYKQRGWRPDQFVIRLEYRDV